MEEKTGNDREDRRLIRLFLKNRDEICFRKMYRRHSPGLYYLALRLVGGTVEEAQELVQETWIRACESLPKFQYRSSLRTWLKGILVNRFREMARYKWKEKERMNLLNTDTESTKGRPNVKIDMERAIDLLPTGYREVLILHDLEGFTHREIGLLLRIEPGTSKSQLFHARKSIRAFFTPEGNQNER